MPFVPPLSSVRQRSPGEAEESSLPCPPQKLATANLPVSLFRFDVPFVMTTSGCGYFEAPADPEPFTVAAVVWALPRVPRITTGATSGCCPTDGPASWIVGYRCSSCTSSSTITTSPLTPAAVSLLRPTLVADDTIATSSLFASTTYRCLLLWLLLLGTTNKLAAVSTSGAPRYPSSTSCGPVKCCWCCCCWMITERPV